MLVSNIFLCQMSGSLVKAYENYHEVEEELGTGESETKKAVMTVCLPFLLSTTCAAPAFVIIEPLHSLSDGA